MANDLNHQHSVSTEALPQREQMVDRELASIQKEVVELQRVLAELQAQLRNASTEKSFVGERYVCSDQYLATVA